ncbi:MAG: hypothetical protein HY848_06400 [Betaproteobacteria bacterium]|nr:hypothetical protein [Betaproteobacteria bacterium]
MTSSWGGRVYAPFLWGGVPRGLLHLKKLDAGERCQIPQVIGAVIERDTLKHKA